MVASRRRLLGASTAWEIFDSAGRHLRFAEDGRDDVNTKAYRSAARELLHRALDRPDINLSTVRCMSSRTKAKVTHLALLKHLRRCRLGFERIRSKLSGFSTALLWDGTSGDEHLHKAGDSFQQWRVAVLPRTSDSPCALLVRELLLEMNFKMDTEVVTVKCLEESWLWLQERTCAKDLHAGTVDATLQHRRHGYQVSHSTTTRRVGLLMTHRTGAPHCVWQASEVLHY